MRKLTTKEFVERAKLLHGDKWDYDRVDYVDMFTKVEIVCPKHGPFFQAPSNHLKGHGCPTCNRVDTQRITMDEFLARSRAVHGDRYDYSRVAFEGTKSKVEIVCPVHGPFMQTPEKHMAGQTCPRCCVNYKDTRESFEVKARKVHGDLYDYSKVEYVDQHTKVCIVDPVYGEFWQQPNAHLNGRGHPARKSARCYATKRKNNSFHTSKPEVVVYGLLVDKFGPDDVFKEYRSERYPFACDFYVRSLDLYIELNIYVTHGKHWFDATDLEDRARLDFIKSRATSRNLYERMIRVWTVMDPEKRRMALANNLNYLVFWDEDLTDFHAWYDNFDKDPVLKQF